MISARSETVARSDSELDGIFQNQFPDGGIGYFIADRGYASRLAGIDPIADFDFFICGKHESVGCNLSFKIAAVDQRKPELTDRRVGQ